MHIYIDEAGRGPLAGPVYVGLVLLELDDKKYFDAIKKLGFKDSKKLSEKQREKLFDSIRYKRNICTLDSGSESGITDLLQDIGNNIKYSFAYSSAKYIDKKGIVPAIRDAILKGLYKLLFATEKYSLASLKKYPSLKKITLHIDGNTDFGLGKKLPGWTIKTYIKGDDLIAPISIASVIAKVSRDRYMTKISYKYIQYGFTKHKGYGTLSHRQAIKKYGLSDIHRKSFCRNI